MALDVSPSAVIPLPQASGLFLAAAVVRGPNGAHSATGVAETHDLALARLSGEIAEVHVLLAMSPDRRDTQPDRTGLAAGRSVADAEHRAIAEAIERHAALRWWGGEVRAAEVATDLLDEFRAKRLSWGHDLKRQAGLIDVTRPGLWPVLVAWSTNTEGGDLCLGVACATRAQNAAAGALRELCQMEFALSLARRRSAEGRTLEPVDRNLIDRADHLDPARLHDGVGPGLSDVGGSTVETRADLDRALMEQGLRVVVSQFPDVFDGLHVAHARLMADDCLTEPAETGKMPVRESGHDAWVGTGRRDLYI